MSNTPYINIILTVFALIIMLAVRFLPSDSEEDARFTAVAVSVMVTMINLYILISALLHLYR